MTQVTLNVHFQFNVQAGESLDEDEHYEIPNDVFDRYGRSLKEITVDLQPTVGLPPDERERIEMENFFAINSTVRREFYSRVVDPENALPQDERMLSDNAQFALNAIGRPTRRDGVWEYKNTGVGFEIKEELKPEHRGSTGDSHRRTYSQQGGQGVGFRIFVLWETPVDPIPR